MRAPATKRFWLRSAEKLSGYGLHALKRDVLAGITVALFSLPMALALGVASIPLGARMPIPAPVVGLIAAIISGIVVSVLGGSRVQIATPSVVFLPLTFSVVDRFGFDGLMLSTIMAGCILAGLGLSKMGRFIELIPPPVTRGLATGISASVIAGLAVDFLGIRSDAPVPREVPERIQWIWTHIPEVNPLATGLALASVLIILFWPRIAPGRVPGTMVAVVFVSAVLTGFLASGADGLATIGNRFGVDSIPLHLPSFALPVLSLARIQGLLAPAMAIALLCSVESLSSARLAGGLSRDRHNPDTELMAQGAANVLSPLFSGLPSAGNGACTSASVLQGGRTPVAGLAQVATLLVLTLALSHFVRFVPVAALAAALVMAAFRMGFWHDLVRLRRMPTEDAGVFLVTFLATVVFDLAVAVEVAIALAALLFARRYAGLAGIPREPAGVGVTGRESSGAVDGIPSEELVFDVKGPLGLDAAERLQNAVLSVGALPRVLILRMGDVVSMDATDRSTLDGILERVRLMAGDVILCETSEQALHALSMSGFAEKIGRSNIHGSLEGALGRARELRDPLGRSGARR